jgi:hypothetical protein
MSYQFSRGAEQSICGAINLESVQPIAEASVIGLIAAAVVRVRQTPELACDRARMAALAAAILIGLQLSADYWASLYVVWIAPVLCASLLAGPRAAATETELVAHARLQTAAVTAG